MSKIDWVQGDLLQANIPAHEAALRDGGKDFLTRAFHATGALQRDNRVTHISRMEECPGGSTGRKLLLSVEYEQPSRELHRELFVKFSRDFDDPIRDQGRGQLESEVRLALLSRNPGFPIRVPTCYFADYHQSSGTGVLITQCIPFGKDGNEPLYEKCMDYELPQPLTHYQAIFKALARLAGTQKSGQLTKNIARHFPFEADRQAVSQPKRYNLEQLQRRLHKYVDFAEKFPGLLPEHIRSEEFIDRLHIDVAHLLEMASAIKSRLHDNPDMIALIHWNANIDNAWFWRGEAGELDCGLLDWGMVSQMNLGGALWGALSAAETSLWNDHLDSLLRLFADEYRHAGGPPLDPERLRVQLVVIAVLLGLSWLMDAPALIQREIPNLAGIPDRFDPAFRNNETARVQLQMMTNLMNLWQRYDVVHLASQVIDGHR